MAFLELPHTSSCLVCGRDNPYGLKLSLHVDQGTGIVHTSFIPTQHHIGFESIVHGGVLATILDEAMVWAATWRYGRFCLCAEMNVRFIRPARVGEELKITAQVESFRPRLSKTIGQIHNAQGQLLAEGNGKYIPMAPENNRAMMSTLIDETATSPAAQILRQESL